MRALLFVILILEVVWVNSCDYYSATLELQIKKQYTISGCRMKCKNIPRVFFIRVVGVHVNSECVKLWEEHLCRGRFGRFQAGYTNITEPLRKNILSISHCSYKDTPANVT
ncbi:hypothetical protein PPYR_15567 [Photinus pyralis]|uniref:Uncharacterized protein n=1 Tax=Photinus pyralis TaxID=7054 RepID=A0A1Y1LMQ4_PHOPY|nr:hypothetical protein PPYR_15567 [Photinus pyralis]